METYPLSKSGFFQYTVYMPYKIFSNSSTAWDSMIESIDHAQSSIYIEMYAFLDDNTTHDFIGKIRQKSEQGIQVVIIADLIGSSEIKNASVEILRTSGAEFIFFNQWLTRIHRKVLIIDRKTAFIGGVNIGENFKHWNDLHLRIRNKHLVRSILRSFANTYRIVGGKNHSILKLGKQTLPKKLKSWMLHHWPGAKRRNYLKNLYIQKISGAKKSILITTPYFAPPFWLARLLKIAVLHGIKVEIIIPKRTDLFLADQINYFFMRRLHKFKIRFLLFPKMNHAKSLLIDDSEFLIGSQNLDLLSFYLNPELSIFSKDKKLVQNFRKIIHSWKKIAIPFKDDSEK